jgi:hypothetical protein
VLQNAFKDGLLHDRVNQASFSDMIIQPYVTGCGGSGVEYVDTYDRQLGPNINSAYNAGNAFSFHKGSADLQCTQIYGTNNGEVGFYENDVSRIQHNGCVSADNTIGGWQIRSGGLGERGETKVIKLVGCDLRQNGIQLEVGSMANGQSVSNVMLEKLAS